jgi:hypothetical protein
MARLRAAGFNHKFCTLEEGISHYIQNFLTQPDAYR